VTARPRPSCSRGRTLVVQGGRGGGLADLVGVGGVERREGAGVAEEGFFGNLPVVDAADGRRRAGEALAHDLGAEAKGFEHLGAAVAEERADAHLRHDLQEAGADGFGVVLASLLGGDGFGGLAGGGERGDELEREPRVDGVDAEAEQARELMHIASLAGLGDEDRSGCGDQRARVAGAPPRRRAAWGQRSSRGWRRGRRE